MLPELSAEEGAASFGIVGRRDVAPERQAARLRSSWRHRVKLKRAF